jgi:putative redox protein
MIEPGLGQEQYWAGLQAALSENAVVVTDSGNGPWGQVAMTRDHMLFADEPVALQGMNTGPSPTGLLLLALGSCTAVTVRMYAARKGWRIDRIAVRLQYGPDTPPSPVHRHIERRIEIDGPLDADQRARLFAIAEKCPVHQILTGGVAVHSELASADG